MTFTASQLATLSATTKAHILARLTVLVGQGRIAASGAQKFLTAYSTLVNK